MNFKKKIQYSFNLNPYTPQNVQKTAVLGFLCGFLG